MLDRDDQLADLLIRWDDAKAARRPVSPQQLCRDTPTLLPDFTKLLRQLRRVDPVFDGAAEVIGNEVDVIDAGRFDPLAYHAEGGLGVVYLAEDAELKRPVALKWMKPLPCLDPVARQRFLQEAEITGKLEHPGIAPVYGAGHDPHGRPFYAMRFIHGTTLGDAVERYHALPVADTTRPVEFARLLRAFISVCQTVAYAHARGVIHRDLKPGNVMLGPYGETLVVDWGLAKRVDVSDPEATAVPGHAPVRLDLVPGDSTVYGEVKGSPAYMAPEQARGESVGPPADVYALGATLYAVLTGHPPYTGTSGQDVIAKVTRVAPLAARLVSLGVPRPLDAICTKAMSREPADRYPTPLELAADLEHWLADEPASAYRDPFPTRARRWVKRHRTPVATGLAALLVVGVALAVVVPLLAAKNRELTGKSDALERANADLKATNAARKNDFEEGDGVLRAVMQSVFDRAAVSQDQLTRKFRTHALSRYHEYLKAFITRNTTREDVRVEVAMAWLKAGEIEAMTSRLDDCLASFAEGERRFAALAVDAPRDRDTLFGLACARLQRGAALNSKGRIADARPLLESARDTFAALATDPTPIHLTGYTSVEGVLEDSPRLRLVDATLELARVQDKVDAAKRTGTPLATVRGESPMRAALKAALIALTDGKPLPATAPIFHKLKEFALRLELTTSAPDPAAAAPDAKQLLAEIEPFVTEYPRLVEFQHLKVAALQFVARNPAQNDAGPVVLRRLTEVENAAIGLTLADHGLDHLGLLDDARLVLADARSDIAEYDLGHYPPGAKTRFQLALDALTELASREQLAPDTRFRAILLCTRIGQVAALDSSRQCRPHSEKAYEVALKLLAPLRVAAPEDADLRPIELMLHLARAVMRGGQGLPLGESLPSARRLLATLKQAGPDDEFLALAEMLLATAEVLELRAEPHDPADRLARVRFAIGRLADAERFGLSPAVVDCQRIGLDVQLAWFLAEQAKAKRDARPPDREAEMALLDQAIRTVRDRLAVKVRHDPAVSPSMKPYLEFLRSRAETMLEVLVGLKKKAAEKK